MMEDFDLIEVQNSVRGCHSTSKLYELFEWVSRLYETHKMGSYEYEETTSCIKARMTALNDIKRQVDK